MTLWTSAEIAQATGGTASTSFEATGVAFDSREVGPGDLFVALQGEVTDGHRFLDAAFAQGAAGAIVSTPCDRPHVRVRDTMRALEDLGRAARARTDATVIGVTGSVGKTSAKEALYAALERSHDRVHRSVKSYNNHTGVPLSLARMPQDSAYAVLEMGMNHPGEIRALTAMVRPHVAVVTAIAPAHIEFFDSIEGIADAKAEIFEGLEPDGIAVIPYDSPHRDRLAGHARRYAERVVTFGSSKGADVRAREVMRLPTGGTFVNATLPNGRELSFTVAQPGEHWVSNALAVVAAVDAAGADLGQAGLALAEMGGLPGRGARVRVKAGEGEALIIDESYNANAASMRAGLAVLAHEPGRRIAVLGEMRELGRESERLHAELAGPIAAAGVETALLVGEAMEPLARALEDRVNIVHVANGAAALDRVRGLIGPGDAVLVKGSNGVGLSRLVAALAGG